MVKFAILLSQTNFKRLTAFRMRSTGMSIGDIVATHRTATSADNSISLSRIFGQSSFQFTRFLLKQFLEFLLQSHMQHLGMNRLPFRVQLVLDAGEFCGGFQNLNQGFSQSF